MIYCLFHVSDRSSWIQNILTSDFLQRFHFSTYYEYDILFISRFRSFFLNSKHLDKWLPSAIPLQHILRIWYIVYFTFQIVLPEFITSWQVTSFSDSTSAHITNMIHCLFHVSDRSSWIHNILTSDFLQWFHYSTYYKYDILFISLFRSFFLNSLPLDTWLPSAIPFQHILRMWYLVYFTFKIFLSEFVTSWHVTSFSDSISAHITNMIYCLFHV